MAFSADGRGVLSGAKDGTIRFWPTNAASRERVYAGSWTPIKFSKDGRMLAAIDEESRFVLLNLRTGEPEDGLQLGRIPFGPWAGAISDDLRLLADPLPERGARVWDLQSRKSVDLKSHEISNGGTTTSPRDIKRHEIHISWAAISADGTALLTGGGNDAALWWNLQDASEAPVHLEAKGALFSRNGNVLATLHDRFVRVWIAKTRSFLAEVPVEADLGFVTPLALSDNGNILGVGSNPLTETDNAIRLWNTQNGKLLGVCKGHTQGVRWIAFAPDGETLASDSDDSTLRFWSVRAQQELLSLRRLTEPVREILFPPDGHWLAAKTFTGLRFLDGSSERNAFTNRSGGE